MDTPLDQSQDSTPHLRTYAEDVARLTGKPLPKKTENVPAPQPTPVPEPPPPLPDPVPQTNAQPAPPKETIPPISQDPLSPVHTYKSDFAAHAEKQGASRISILSAQMDAGTAARPANVLPQKQKSWFLPFALGIVLMLVGGSAVYFAYRYTTTSQQISELLVPSLIFADDRIELHGSGEELRQELAAAVGADTLPEGGVAIMYLTYATTTKQGTVYVPAEGGALIEALRLPAPSILFRNIESISTAGVLKAEGETRPFFIFKVSSYERTFAGMLDWEATMEQDLAVFYPRYLTETATTTPFRLSFVDGIVDNRDVRLLFDAGGKTIMLYGYRDKETLIIARNEAAFSELLSRLAATGAQ